jgi:hypothetical protein
MTTRKLTLFAREICCRVVLAVELGPPTLFNHAKQQFAQKFSMNSKKFCILCMIELCKM